MPGSLFYSDPSITANFIAVCKEVVARYCQDISVMAWETGNELELPDSSGPPPAEWTIAVAAAIKGVLNQPLCKNSRQLVIDGSFGSVHGWSDQVLADPNIDGFTGHCKDY